MESINLAEKKGAFVARNVLAKNGANPIKPFL
jgi:hypothetical protein